MITRLSLTNFKGVKQGEVRLSPLTVLVGSNNAGKTTILEALFLAPNPIRRVAYGETSGSSAVDIVRRSHATLDSSGFAFLMLDYRGKQATILCEIDGEPYSLGLWQQESDIFLTSTRQNANSGFAYGDKRQHRAFGVLHVYDNGTQGSASEPFVGEALLINPSLIDLGYDYLRRNWGFIMNSGVGRQVAKEVSELSPEKYTDLTLESFFANTMSLNAYRDDGKRIRLGDLGAGIQEYILARMLYEVQQPNLLLWDDIESHFNPRILVRLSEWFSDLIAKGKQVVLTTHSLEAIQLLTEYNKENASILLVSLTDNILDSRSFSFDALEESRKAGIDVRIGSLF